MDEVLKRRIVGVVALMAVALLLSWLLPTPGLHTLRGDGERRVTIDLTKPDSPPQEWALSGQESTPAAPASTDPKASQVPQRAPDEVPEQAPGEAAPQPGASEPAAAAPATNSAEVEPKATPPAVEPPEPPATKPGAPPSASPTVKPAAKPATPPDKPPAPPPVAAKPAAPASGAGNTQIQAGAYSHLDKAEGVRDGAQGLGVPCRIVPVDTAKGTLYRVRCGPYADAAAADVAIRSLATKGIAAQVVSGGR